MHKRMTKKEGEKARRTMCYPLRRQELHPKEKARVREEKVRPTRTMPRVKEKVTSHDLFARTYLKEAGCPRGDQCTDRHPPRVGKCLHCEATGHQLSSCRRPRRDAQPKAATAAKPKAAPQAKARAKSQGKPKMKPGGRKAANALWAEGADQETTVQIEEVDEAALSSEGLFTACSFFTFFLPTFHNASAETSANATEARDMAPILDSGATHCLLPLSWLSDENAEQAKRIHLRVASGDQARALLFNNITYAKSVTRPLVSIGQLKAMLDLRFVWDDGPPIQHHLPGIDCPSRGYPPVHLYRSPLG